MMSFFAFFCLELLTADGLDSLACPELEEPLNSWSPVLMGQGENGAAGLVP